MENTMHQNLTLLEKLPVEILRQIFSYFEPCDVLHVAVSSRYLNVAISGVLLWRSWKSKPAVLLWRSWTAKFTEVQTIMMDESITDPEKRNKLVEKAKEDLDFARVAVAYKPFSGFLLKNFDVTKEVGNAFSKIEKQQFFTWVLYHYLEAKELGKAECLKDDVNVDPDPAQLVELLYQYLEKGNIGDAERVQDGFNVHPDPERLVEILYQYLDKRDIGGAECLKDSFNVQPDPERLAEFRYQYLKAKELEKVKYIESLLEDFKRKPLFV